MSKRHLKKFRENLRKISSLEKLDFFVRSRLRENTLTDYEFGLALLKRLVLSTHDESYIERTKTPRGFTKETAEAYGYSRRTIQRYLRVAKAIKLKSIPDNQIALYQESKISYIDIIEVLKKS